MIDFPRWKIFLTLIVLFAAFITVFLDFSNKYKHNEYTAGIKLGLDLRGGSYIVLEADEEILEKEYYDSTSNYVLNYLRNEDIQFSSFRRLSSQDKISFKIKDTEKFREINSHLKNIDAYIITSLDDDIVTVSITSNSYYAEMAEVIQSAIKIVRNRIDSVGITETVIRQQGNKRITVELPGIENPSQVKRILGTTARLSFHLVDVASTFQGASLKQGYRYVRSDDRIQGRYALKSQPEILGTSVNSAKLQFQDNRPVVFFSFDTEGGRKFADITSNNIGGLIAIVLDNKVISAPSISTAITGGSGVIQGSFSVETAQELAILLQAGSLPIPLEIVEERTVGPTLGKESINDSIFSAIIGYLALFMFMGIFYKKLGLVGNIAMLLNTVVMLSILSLVGVTLTLPGIAGIILTLGMAIDANILVYEKFAADMRNLKQESIPSAFSASFKRVFYTIIDSNTTTFLVAILLFSLGSGPIKGFAITLIIGLISSIFSIMFITKMLANFIYINKFLKKPKRA